jgi:hypothetical protein
VECSPPAYSVQTGYVCVLGMKQLMSFTSKKEQNSKGSTRLGRAFTNIKKGAMCSTEQLLKHISQRLLLF